ncbi:MAG TPA: peptide chain release factor N(5)-glutamine methyltransferase [SAR86 cluster bacterium]|jgi:release factor glutamine methyltransferase|nr:peptide chain release factor N(5)-glutamine methyltransferase [SAR86 cluster bacterium]
MSGENSLELIYQLSKKNLDQYCSKQDVELLVLHILGINRNVLYREDPSLTENQSIMLKYFIKRRNLGEPLAYIIGNKGFWNLELFVDENVLVPRPETELLVERILSLYNLSPLRLLDLGTGSGAIGLSLISERPSWEVYCSDLSFKALKVTQENKNNNKMNVHLINADWLSAFSINSFDVIVSNPPYVDQNDKRLFEDGVSFEPMEALVAEERGLKDVQHIIRHAKDYLRDSGCLLVEHAPEQSKDVIDLFNDYSYSSIRQFQDLNGDDRVSFGKIV